MYFTKSFKNLWNYTRNLLTIWNFTQSKIILHKRCLRCLWQILCLNRLPWSHLNHTFVPFAISSITLNGDVNDCVLNMTQGEAVGVGQLDLARDHRLHYFHNLGEDLFGAVQCVHICPHSGNPLVFSWPWLHDRLGSRNFTRGKGVCQGADCCRLKYGAMIIPTIMAQYRHTTMTQSNDLQNIPRIKFRTQPQLSQCCSHSLSFRQIHPFGQNEMLR